MNTQYERRWCSMFLLGAASILAGCASYSGRGLEPGQATYDQVLETMGKPAMEWRDNDGSRQLAYPKGPSAPHTVMVKIGPDGRMQSLGNVLNYKYFAKIQPGKTTQADVLRLLGPSTPQWTVYFQARDELVWEWLYCDDMSLQGRFDVLFDGQNGPVRTTQSRPDYRGRDGIVPTCGQMPPPKE